MRSISNLPIIGLYIYRGQSPESLHIQGLITNSVPQINPPTPRMTESERWDIQTFNHKVWSDFLFVEDSMAPLFASTLLSQATILLTLFSTTMSSGAPSATDIVFF
jgi:hypothetical protein